MKKVKSLSLLLIITMILSLSVPSPFLFALTEEVKNQTESEIPVEEQESNQEVTEEQLKSDQMFEEEVSEEQVIEVIDPVEDQDTAKVSNEISDSEQPVQESNEIKEVTEEVTEKEVVPLAEEEVTFKDEILAQAVYNKIGKWENITPTDMQDLSSLEIFNEENISNLSGLEFAENLTYIYIANSEIQDFTPISKLENLEILTLNNNHDTKSNILQNLEQLTGLRHLGLINSDISSLSSISHSSDLSTLNLTNNNISDLSGIESLSKITSLTLSNNNISNLSPLSDLTNLESLSIAYNKITNVKALEKLTNLTLLDISNNSVKDLSPVVSMPKLTSLYIAENKVSKLNEISSLPLLQYLILTGNPLDLSKKSETYHTVQELFEKKVNIILDPESVFSVKTKEVTQDSITIEWSKLANTNQIGNLYTVSIDGKKATEIESDSNVLEYTFENLEKGKEYSIEISYIYSSVNFGGLETKTLSVTTNEKEPSNNSLKEELVSVKPTIKNNTAVITNEDINLVKNQGMLVLDLTSLSDQTAYVELSSEQINELQARGIDLEIDKDDVLIQIPSENFKENEGVTITLEPVEEVSGALTKKYDFTIESDTDTISTFTEPVTLKFKVDEEAISNPANVKVWYYNPNSAEWELIGGEYKNGFVTAETSHFSEYAVFEKEPVNESAPLSENELPNTASETFNLLIGGSLLILMASGFLIFNRRKNA